MDVCELKKGDLKEWDAFVIKSDNSTFYHLTGWKTAIEKTYRHRPYYLLVRDRNDNNRIRGILPIFLIKSRIFGKFLVSNPFGSCGGICADNKDARRLLLDEAKRITRELDADYLELRNCAGMPGITENSGIPGHAGGLGITGHTESSGITGLRGGVGITEGTGSEFHGNLQKEFQNDSYYMMVLKLNPDPGILWKNFSKKVRNSTRKAIRSNLKTYIDREGLDDFFRIYARNMRDLGTPVHSIEFFRNMMHEFSNQTNLLRVEHKGKVIGGLFLVSFKDTLRSEWGSSHKKYLSLCPNNLMYWGAIKHACEKGYQYFDFGRSRMGSGTFRFKEAWGAKPKQLHYTYHLNKSENPPDMDPDNPKYNILTRIWKLIPVPVSTLIGPVVRRNIP